jgi:hypothetical protein
VNIKMNSNHGGRMRIAVCPYPQGDARLNQACFNQSSHWLRRVSSDAKYNNKVYW